MAAHRAEGLEEAALVQDGYDIVRVGYADLIGSDRGRVVLVNGFARTAEDGLAFCRSVYGTTPMGDVVLIEGGLTAGALCRRPPGPFDQADPLGAPPLLG